MLSGFAETLDLQTLGLAVHDLGGPVGLHWAVGRLDRIRGLAVLNTLVYPQLSWAVVAFLLAARTPGIRRLLTGPWGLKQALRIGVSDPSKLRDDAVASFQAPFTDPASRRALAKAGVGLHPDGLRTLSEGLGAYTGPVALLYGTEDRILPRVARTMARLKADLPQAEVTALAGCGHFLQEEQPEQIGEILGAFFAEV